MPLDVALGLAPHQTSSEELMRLGCLLSVVLPYHLASWLLGQWSGLSVSSRTLWNWVQVKGQKAETELLGQLQAQAAGAACVPEPSEASLLALPLAIAADGVMVPFHPPATTPTGKTRWQEIKVGILTRLGERVNRDGKRLPQLLHRRVVAVLGDIDAFIPRLRLEAKRQMFESATQVIWLSDGDRGFWRVYRTCFAYWVSRFWISTTPQGISGGRHTHCLMAQTPPQPRLGLPVGDINCAMDNTSKSSRP